MTEKEKRILPKNYDRELLNKIGDIKRSLVEYTLDNFSDLIQEKIDKVYGMRAVSLSQGERIRFIDNFIMQELLPIEQGGGWVIDYFLKEDPIGRKLSEKEQAILLGWRDNVVEGFFEILQRDTESEAILLYNLINEMEYVVRSNIGPKLLGRFSPGAFVLTRLVPMDDYWILSGDQNLYDAKDRKRVLLAAAKQAQLSPELVMQNPAKAEHARTIQRRDRAAFVTYFGSDTVVVPGKDLQRTMEEFFRYRIFQWMGEGSDQEAEGLTGLQRFQELHPGEVPSVPNMEMPPHLVAGETVGAIYDYKEGLSYYLDFGIFQEVFQKPELLNQKKYFEILEGYLVSDTISTVPFDRMKALYPENTAQILGKIAKAEIFDLEEDYIELMKEFKQELFLRKKYPSVIMLPENLQKVLAEEEKLKAKMKNLKGANSDWKRAVKSSGKKRKK